MAKIQQKADPTFKVKVPFPVAGGPAVDVELEFRHRTKKQLEEFAETRKGKTDAETFLEMVVGWELDDELNAENVSLLLEHRMGAGLAAYTKYIDELYKHKTGN